MTPEENASRIEKIRIRALHRESHRRLQKELREWKEAALLEGAAQTGPATSSSPTTTSPGTAPPASSIVDLNRLREYASCAENGLHEIASALHLAQEAILEFIAPRTWADFQLEAIRISKVRANAALRRRLEAGDLKAWEYLSRIDETSEISPQDRKDLENLRQLRTMSDEELTAYRKRLLAVIEAPRGLERWEGKLPPTVRLLSKAEAAAIQTVDAPLTRPHSPAHEPLPLTDGPVIAKLL